MGVRTMRRLILGLLVLAMAVACSPMPNPNPSAGANELNGVGTPNALRDVTPRP